MDGLGTFIEVEVIDTDNKFSTVQLKEQCDYYLQFFNIEPQQLLKESYSDLLRNKKKY